MSATPDITDRGVTVRTVAATLGCSTAYVYQIIRRGELPAIRLGSAVRVLRSDLDAFIKCVRVERGATR